MRVMRIGGFSATLALLGVVFVPSIGAPQSDPRWQAPPPVNTYGLPGYMDTPDAASFPDAQFVTTIGGFGNSFRQTLTFQISPRLTGSFRYTILRDFFRDDPTTDTDNRYDRSFDLQYRLLDERRYRPAVSVGLRDLLGTGNLSSEYVVASKTVLDGLRVSAGLGWGRLGSVDPIGSTGNRETGTAGEGGIPNADRWFRGDFAPFAGVAYSVNDRLTFKAEYSADDYATEENRGLFETERPWSYGVDYRWESGTQLSLYHAYGSEIGAQVTFQFNPKTLGTPGGLGPAPFPVAPRAPGAAADLGWATDDARIATADQTLRALAAEDGLVVETLALEPRRAVVRMRNPRFGATSEAVGRMARMMTRALPASVETFEIIPIVDGMPVSSILLQRTDLERLEHAPAADMLDRAVFVDAAGRAPRPAPGAYPRLDWSLLPYLDLSVFDPSSPVRGDAGLRLSGSWQPVTPLEVSGSLSQRLVGSLSDARLDESNLPRVRTDQKIYSEEGATAVDRLHAAYYARPSDDMYTRLTFGYLEPMYAGLSGELLWKPVASRLALGLEVNAVRRRDYDQLFGLQDMTTTDPETGIEREIPDLNGHLSAYYDFGNGYHGQVDAGRFLAGDWGARIGLDREFANGWRVGAFATFTDATADDFGEGSFDKGLRVTIPLEVLTGQPSRTRNDVELRSLTRDGGARLSVDGRLYERVRDYHRPEMAETWGRFWR